VDTHIEAFRDSDQTAITPGSESNINTQTITLSHTTANTQVSLQYLLGQTTNSTQDFLTKHHIPQSENEASPVFRRAPLFDRYHCSRSAHCRWRIYARWFSWQSLLYWAEPSWSKLHLTTFDRLLNADVWYSVVLIFTLFLVRLQALSSLVHGWLGGWDEEVCR
jgi:hypothetical protein